MPCFYCGVRLRSKGPAMRTKDHVVPKSKGGTKTVEACLRCNGKKADLDLEQFRALCGGIEFWAERTARIEAQKVDWIYQFNTAVTNITPVDYQKAIHKEPLKNFPKASGKLKKPQFDELILNSLPDLRGVKFGSFTVGLYKKGRWRCTCICGAIEPRTTKAVRNPNNSWDACVECRRLAYDLKRELFKETGKYTTEQECFRDVYRYFEAKRIEEESCRLKDENIMLVSTQRQENTYQ